MAAKQSIHTVIDQEVVVPDIPKCELHVLYAAPKDGSYYKELYTTGLSKNNFNYMSPIH